MRAEGVLRLILNVSLYVGMSCLEDGKHVRMTVFEGKQRQFITFRVCASRGTSADARPVPLKLRPSSAVIYTITYHLSRLLGRDLQRQRLLLQSRLCKREAV